MRLTVQDQLALMMTSAGSQRRLGAFIGISHQRVGRWLRHGQEGGSKNLPDDPDVIGAINQAFAIHRQVSRQQARVDKLHFNSKIPIYARRLPIAAREKKIDPVTGEIYFQSVLDSEGKQIYKPGDRVAIEHTHWLSNKLLNRVIADAQKSGKYYAASVGSLVNLQIYNKRADQRMVGQRRTEIQKLYKKQIKARLKLGQEKAWVFTPYVSTPGNVDSDLITNRIADLLRERHEPATGTPGAKLAAQILLQVDTRKKK